MRKGALLDFKKAMTKHDEILNFISIIRDSHPDMVNIFTLGSCWDFYLILKDRFPSSIPYYEIGHIITKIEDRFYDITGEIIESENKYLPFFGFYVEVSEKRVLKTWKNSFWKKNQM